MDSVSGKILDKLQSVTLELLRKSIVSSIKDGDGAWGFLKVQLQTEFEHINSKLDKLICQELLFAQQFVGLGLDAMQSRDSVKYVEYWNEVFNNATKAFAKSK